MWTNWKIHTTFTNSKTWGQGWIQGVENLRADFEYLHKLYADEVKGADKRQQSYFSQEAAVINYVSVVMADAVLCYCIMFVTMATVRENGYYQPCGDTSAKMVLFSVVSVCGLVYVFVY